MGHRVLQALQEQQGLQERRDQLVLQEQQGPQERWSHKECRASKAQRDHSDCRALQKQRGQWRQWGQRGQRATGPAGPTPDTSLYVLKASPTFLGNVSTEELAVGSTTANTNFTVYRNLSLSGSLSGYSLFWCAGRIGGTTTVPTILTKKGVRALEIAWVRKSGQATGVYKETWTTAHPDGANWIGMVSVEHSS